MYLVLCCRESNAVYNKTMTTAKINKAIKDLNLEIVHQRGSGYSYFLDLTTGNQIGESVVVCYLNQLTLPRWVEEAEYARKNDKWYEL
jgi:hypothetical protein